MPLRISKQKQPCILGLDPGFANLGWSVVTGSKVSKLRLVQAGCFETSKASKKQNVLVADDNFRRAKKIAWFMLELQSQWGFSLICAESMSFPRNASAAAKMSLAWGVIACFCEVHEIPLLSATPKQIKTELCPTIGKPTDPQLHAAVRSRYRRAGELITKSLPTKTAKHEHAYDSVGAIEACKSSDLMLTLFKRWR